MEDNLQDNKVGEQQSLFRTWMQVPACRCVYVGVCAHCAQNGVGRFWPMDGRTQPFLRFSSMPYSSVLNWELWHPYHPPIKGERTSCVSEEVFRAKSFFFLSLEHNVVLYFDSHSVLGFYHEEGMDYHNFGESACFHDPSRSTKCLRTGTWTTSSSWP